MSPVAVCVFITVPYEVQFKCIDIITMSTKPSTEVHSKPLYP